MRNLFIYLAIALFSFSSCENEVDVNAEWKEIPVVFGLLNNDESTHFVRVSKAFLGQGDALQFAQAFDSLYQNPSIMEVRIDEVIDGDTLRTFQLEARTDIPKEPGIFHSPAQIVYAFETGTEPLLDDAEYFLSVKNTQSGAEAKARTRIVHGMSMKTPSILANEITILPQPVLPITWNKARNGKIYEAIIYFLYREFNQINPTDTLKKTAIINLGRQVGEGTGDMSSRISGADFYQSLVSQIPANSLSNPVARMPDSLRIIINVADDNFNTYLNVNQPSNTISQERPQFTNIENGLGVFASRNTFEKTYYISNTFVDSLRNNNVTSVLNILQR